MGGNQSKLMRTWGEHANFTQKHPNSDSNPGPSCCEATAVTPAPPYWKQKITNFTLLLDASAELTSCDGPCLYFVLYTVHWCNNLNSAGKLQFWLLCSVLANLHKLYFSTVPLGEIICMTSIYDCMTSTWHSSGWRQVLQNEKLSKMFPLLESPNVGSTNFNISSWWSNLI